MSDGALPARLGRYDIVERLSAGGMGEVFVGRFVAPGGFVKPVAVKRIHPHLAEDEQFIHMLHDEANVAAAVKHPNIVGTIDVGSEGESHYVVLDYVSGEPLSRLVRELKRRNLFMPQWLAAWIGAETASALHAAHEARDLAGEPLEIVHRDVSLANVMLADGGHPMLFDFGVAKAKQRLHQTTAGELKGKLAYMAPEAFLGASIDRTIDVFALGVLLYELFTRRSPFQRDTDLETISALKSAVVPPPSAVVPQLDRRLDAIVMTAMARERAERYPTAAHVERALRAWAREAEVPHEAAAAARWVEATFPERIALRRALLARVADLSHRPAAAAVHTPARGTPGPFSPGQPALTPAGYAAPPSGSYAAPPSGSYPAPISGISGPYPASSPGFDPRLTPATGPGFAVTGTGAQLTVGGIAAEQARTEGATIGRWVGAAALSIAILGGALVAYLVFARTPSPAAEVPVESRAATTTSSAATPIASATATALASASASPSTSSSASASAPAASPSLPAPKAPSRPAEPPPKGRGPIMRSYD